MAGHSKKNIGPFSLARSQTSGNGKTYLFGKAVYSPGGRFGPGVQKDFQLVVLTQGNARVSVNHAEHDILPGEAILQRPGARVFYRFSREAGAQHTWCQIAAARLSPIERGLLESASSKVYKVPPIIHRMIEEGLATGYYESEEMHGAMTALARTCALWFAAHAPLEGKKGAALPQHPALERAVEIATTEYPVLSTTVSLARRAGISASHLRLLWRQARGESPGDFLRRLKIENATQLIRSTGLTLQEIASQCGYANPFHLSRAVKQHAGISPRALRQREWNSS